MHAAPRRLLLAALALALLPAAARAQRERDRDTWNTSATSVDVSGEVRLAGRPAPAAGVSVRLERFGSGVLEQMATDSRGRFRFAGLPRGQYVVVVSAPCHHPAQQQVDLILIFRQYVTFDLKADTASPGCAPVGAAGPADARVVDARVPPAAREQYERGREALAASKSEQGLAHLRKAVELYPDFFEAYLVAASVHTHAGRWPEAERALARAAEINPRSVEALVSLGEVRRRQKKYAEAARSLEAALKLDDAAWQGHFALARVYLDQGEATRAAPHLGRTLQLKPEYAEAHLFAGNLLLKLGEPARALAEYEEYLRLAPTGEYADQARTLTAKLKKTLAARKD